MGGVSWNLKREVKTAYFYQTNIPHESCKASSTQYGMILSAKIRCMLIYHYQHL